VFRAAEGGTLLLDEVGDLPFELQGHLLRVLQERSVRPVGADREVAVDVRVLAATHVDLERAVREGLFREDLLSRLGQMVLVVPPLRNRRTELLRLIREFAPELGFSPSAAEALLLWDWPGNVRELRALLEAHAALNPGAIRIGAQELCKDLPSARRVLSRHAAEEKSPANHTAVERRRHLTELLQQHHGNITEVARALGKPRAQVYRWLRTLGVPRTAAKR
jgi:two-component system response regulator GlrR